MPNGNVFSEEAAERYRKQGEAWAQRQEEVKEKIRERGGLLSTIWESITDFFSAAFTNVWSGFHGFFGSLFGKAEAFLDEINLFDHIRKAPDWWIPVFKRFGFDDNDVQALQSMLPVGIEGHPQVMILIFALMIARQVGNLGEVISGTAYKRLMSKFTPATPTLGEVLRASFVAPELHEEVLRIGRENGLSDEDLKVLFVANYQLQDLQTIRSIYYRDQKPESWLDERLAEHGFTKERIEEIKTAFPFLPTVQDLTFFMAREAFEPGMIQRYGLDELYPAALTEWAQKQGMDEEWAKKYWYAHWEHPGLQTVLEMFHRDQLTDDEMWNYFGLVEIPPFWREKIMNISYNVITRVDARRMYQLGVVDEAKVNEMYRHMGYSPENADLMVEWTKHYASAQDRDLTRTDITQAFIDRDITATEAVELLRKTGYPEDHANFIIYRTEMELIRSTREEKLELVKQQYTSNLISEAEARNTVIGLGFKTERAAELLDKWTFLRWKNTKLPSKTDLDKLYRSSVITETQYTDTMKRLGYADQYINWYLDYIKGSEET